ncbi:MAG: dihydrofolate reductase [Anaerolineae bacterium]|nr:dihydrofolate reductase [Anaerolineae bacterium]
MDTSRQLRISVFIATSLDGYIARPDGDIDWLHNVEQVPEGDDAGYGTFISTIDVLVMGRGSFEKVLEFPEWPYPMPVVVLSKHLKDVPAHLQGRVRIESLSPEELVRKLADEGYKHVYLDGGKVIQSFIRARLVDDMIVTQIPILIGAGLPLFGPLDNDVYLHHEWTKTWPNGFVQSKYIPVYS